MKVTVEDRDEFSVHGSAFFDQRVSRKFAHRKIMAELNSRKFPSRKIEKVSVWTLDGCTVVRSEHTFTFTADYDNSYLAEV